MTFRSLDATHIIGTIERLSRRIAERFPGAGLSGVGRELHGLARECAQVTVRLSRPNWPVRLGVFAVIALMGAVVVAAVVGVVQRLQSVTQISGLSDFVQGVEAGVNDVVFLGVAVYFLISIEARLKRRTALRFIHQLRSIAHIVDMHQLTKDPEHLLSPRENTASSPARTLTRAELGRYLDYCSELLSLTGKIGALFAHSMDDTVVLQAVNEIEDLTNGLSRKIWQKITLLERVPAG